MRRLLVTPCLLLLALALPAGAAAQVFDPPTATTRGASQVGGTTATVHGDVGPGGQPTSYQFEYGTSTSYGFATAPASASDGTSTPTVSESASLTGLNKDTVYHYRIDAWPDATPDQIVYGEDRTFRTLAPPFAGTNSTLDVAADSATLSGKLDPNGSPTTFYFDYGPTNTYGQHTPVTSVGQGSSMLYEQERIAGLAPNSTYHFRLVVTNAAGTSTGQDRGFRTLRAPSSITLATPTPQVRYGHSAVIAGQVQGGGVNGIRLALASTPFPFRAPFTSSSAFVSAAQDGTFRFPTLPIWTATRVHVLTRTTPAVTSPDVTLTPLLITTAGVAKLDRRRAEVSGSIRPRLAGSRAALQRQSGTQWVTVQRTRTRFTPSGLVTYAFTVARQAKPHAYRVMIRPSSRAYAKTATSTVTVPKRAKPPRKKP